MLGRRWLPVLSLLLVASVVWAQGAHTPAKGSAERQAILDAARVKVAADLSYRGAILFRIEDLKVYKGWALFHGQPVTPTGAPISKNCIEADELTVVLLRLRDGAWHVERGGTTCATDAFWQEWQEALGAPSQIFELKGR